MKVLIVEDDKALGLFLQKGLKLDGHETFLVEDGEAALEHVRADQPDLMVLDLSLPKRDGIEVLEELRALSPDTSVLVLTGRNNVEERVRCLNLGADDCLLKPFSFHELAARCRAILRRGNRTSDAVLRSGDLEMDLIRRKVRRQEQVIDLTPKEYALLEFLMRRKGACCSREALLRDVWQTSSETAANSVDVYINYLRKKLSVTGSDGRRCTPIETIRGEGYRITADLAKLDRFAGSCLQPAFARGA